MAKLISANCPSCGANLPVPPGIPQVTCRYCQNVITVQAQKQPPNVTPFGMPGGMPSRTLYVDPAAIRAAQQAGKVSMIVMIAVFALPFIIGIGAAAGPPLLRSCKGAIRPFPVACGINEEVEVTGTYEGTGPIVSSAGVNCKIHVKNSKLKGSSFLPPGQSNVQVTFENVQIETTDTMFRVGSNMELKLIGSTLVSQGDVFDTDSNLKLELENTTLESKGGTAIKSKANLKMRTTAAKIRGKKGGVDTTSSFELDMKKACEITSSDGPAIKSTSGTKIEAEGGKIDGAAGAIVSESSLSVKGTGLTLASAKDKAIQTTSSYRIELSDGAITSTSDAAMELDNSGDVVLSNSTVSGTIGIEGKNGLKVKATKKSRIVGTSGVGVICSNGLEITLADASIEGTTKAIRGGTNTKLKLNGGRVAGKLGAVEAESNLTLEATGASIEGGAGPGISATSNGKVTILNGVLKGNPAIQSTFNLTSDTTGTRVEGPIVTKQR